MKCFMIGFMIVVAILLSACTSSDEATRALSGAGYKNINITGYNFFGCDEKDSFHTGFTATGSNGQHIEGVVCSGLFKGNTIRTN